jgi:hypothetical protein
MVKEIRSGTMDTNRRRGRLALICFLAIFFLAVDSVTELGVADGVLYISIVLLAYSLPRRRSIMDFAVLSSIFTVAGYFLSPPGGELWKVIANRTLAFYAIWVTAVILLRRKKVEEDRERVISELETERAKTKVLSGLLPICFNCKKIRDDQGYWTRLEDYISAHTKAAFSHGLCSECAQLLYPQYYKDHGESR